MFNASLFEKLLVGGSVVGTGLFIGYTMFKSPEVKKEDAFKIRQELLLQKMEGIAEVAFQTGFSSPSYFAKCFKKEFGTTPTEMVARV